MRQWRRKQANELTAPWGRTSASRSSSNIHRHTWPSPLQCSFQYTNWGPLGRFQKGNNESQRPRAVCQEAKGVICLMSIFISYLHPQLVRGGFKAVWFMLRKAQLIKTSQLCTRDDVCKTLPSTLEAPPLISPRNPRHWDLWFYYGKKTNNYYSVKEVSQ